jgi:hypothetical protein
MKYFLNWYKDNYYDSYKSNTKDKVFDVNDLAKAYNEGFFSNQAIIKENDNLREVLEIRSIDFANNVKERQYLEETVGKRNEHIAELKKEIKYLKTILNASQLNELKKWEDENKKWV